MRFNRARTGMCLFGTCLVLFGCTAGFFGRLVWEAEQKRLEDLRKWEASLEELDCDALSQANDSLLERKDQLVDLDQRQDALRDKYAEQKCELPESLL